LAVDVYRVLRDSKDFGLRDQMQRAAVSIAPNIAEGSERSKKEFVRFISISRGSAAELRTQAYIAARIGAIDKNTMKRLVSETKQLSKMLFALAKSVKG